MNVTCAHGWQDGGGLYIFSEGTATLTDTNVYENRADYVCSPVEPSLSSHPAPRWNTTCAHGWQYGGGLFIVGTATLTNTNVYENRADDWTGGGVRVEDNAVVNFEGCHIHDNTVWRP